MVLISAKSQYGVELNGILENTLGKYVTETSASINGSFNYSNNEVLADISGLAAFDKKGGQGSGDASSGISIDPSTIQENSVLAYSPPDASYIENPKFKYNEVIEYKVQSGDTISTIALNYGVSINTIIWANNIRNPNTLSLGQILKIPPVSGVIYTVQKGDTISSIAKRYKTDMDKIVSFNNLQDDQILKIGTELILPDGEKPGPTPYVSIQITSSSGQQTYVPVGDGQCVAFVQAHGFSSLHGNAYQWAKYINTDEPVVGGVVIFKIGRFGHIALITSVKPNSVQVVEQNYYGPYVIDHREVSLNSSSIVGFIK